MPNSDGRCRYHTTFEREQCLLQLRGEPCQQDAKEERRMRRDRAEALLRRCRDAASKRLWHEEEMGWGYSMSCPWCEGKPQGLDSDEYSHRDDCRAAQLLADLDAALDPLPKTDNAALGDNDGGDP